MYKILFSVPVHENLTAILELVSNYLYFNDGCGIVLHVSRRFKEHHQLLKAIPEHVYVNDQRIWSGRADGSQLMMHFMNYEYAKRLKIQFEYFSLNASNELFVRKGVYDYMRRHDAGFENDNVKNFLSYRIPYLASVDPFLDRKTSDGIISERLYSVVEGTFYTQPIFDFIIDQCYEHVMYDFLWPARICYKRYYNHKLIYYSLKKLLPKKFYVNEEVYPPTFAAVVSQSRGWPYCYFNTKHNSGFVTIAEICAIVSQDFTKLPRYDRHQPGRNFFSVKRVERTDHSAVREFIMNSLMKAVSSETCTKAVSGGFK